MQKFRGHKFRGATSAEYGLIFALVLIVSLAAIGGLGGSISTLLSGAGQGAFGSSGSASGLMSILSPVNNGTAPGASLSGAAGGEQAPVISGTSLLPTVSSTGTAAGSTNTTSVEGDNINVLGTMQLSEALEKMAAKVEDPAASQYLKEMSEQLYLMGALQGELDGVPEFEISEVNNDQALSELISMNKKMETMMMNPPANLPPEMLNQAMVFAQDARAINQKYFTALSEYIDPNGNVKSDFFVNSNKPGSVLKDKDCKQTVARRNLDSRSYKDSMPITEVKRKTEKVLTDNKVDSINVEATLTDAVNVDGISSQVP